MYNVNQSMVSHKRDVDTCIVLGPDFQKILGKT